MNSYTLTQFKNMSNEDLKRQAKYVGATNEEINMPHNALAKLAYRLQVEYDGFETLEDEKEIFAEDYKVLSANLEFWVERLTYAPNDTYATERYYDGIGKLLGRAAGFSALLSQLGL